MCISDFKNGLNKLSKAIFKRLRVACIQYWGYKTMDLYKVKNEILKRITIEYQIYDGELDKYDCMTIALKSQIAKHKLCTKDVEQVIGVNSLFLRELYLHDYLEKYNFTYLLKDLNDWYKTNTDSEFSYIKQFSYMMKKFGDDIFKHPLLDDYNMVINLYMKCISKSANNVRKIMNEIEDIIDIAIERVDIDSNFDELQQVKYFSQRLRYECLHYYQKGRYDWKIKEVNMLQHEEAIQDINNHILKKWFNANEDYMNYEWLNKNQKDLISKLYEHSYEDVEWHKNHNNEYDISKKYICELFNFDYNSLKNKINRIKTKNIENKIEVKYEYERIKTYKRVAINDFKEKVDELQRDRDEENEMMRGSYYEDEEYEIENEKEEDIFYLENAWGKIKSYY